MDANDFRLLGLLLAFICFIGIVVWAWSRRNRKRFDEASRLPFADETPASKRKPDTQ